MKDTRKPDSPTVVAQDAFEKHIPDENSYSYVQWKDIRMTVRSMVSFRETLEIVDSVIASCRSTDGEIHPEVMEAAFRSCVAAWYASIQLPEDFDARYRLLFGTNLYKTICGTINEEQLDSIRDALKLRFEKIAR